MNDYETIRKAFDLMVDAHHHRTTAQRTDPLGRQVDKTGRDYVHHPLTVALAAGGNTEVTVCALLHDVLEDTTVTIEELRNCGFSEEIIEALRLLTFPVVENESEEEKTARYLAYIRKIAENPIAKAVKLADLTHNSDISRLPVNERGTAAAKARLEKYRKALAILKAE